jgi:hypothetical protein
MEDRPLRSLQAQLTKRPIDARFVRADVHDDPEHGELQPEPGYIYPRPFGTNSMNTSCHTAGQLMRYTRRFCGVCNRSGLPPIADRCVDILGRQLSATSRNHTLRVTLRDQAD